MPGGDVEKISNVTSPEEARHLLEIALRHEWAVSFEYVKHAYSMPKGKWLPSGAVKDKLAPQLAVKREHLYTQESLLANARRVKGLR